MNKNVIGYKKTSGFLCFHEENLFCKMFSGRCVIWIAQAAIK